MTTEWKMNLLKKLGTILLGGTDIIMYSVCVFYSIRVATIFRQIPCYSRSNFVMSL